MAGAPTKESLDYFPFDIGLLNDRKFRRAKMKHGSLAVLIYITLLELIYGDKGYYLEYSESTKDGVIWDVLNVLQGQYQPKAETIEDVIELLVACELFSQDQFNNKIITSKRIQSTYYKITVDRKVVNINFDYWLLSENEMQTISSRSIILHNYINRSINLINQPINTESQPINTQSKVKESKVNKSKVNESKVNPVCDKVHGIYEKFNTICTRLNLVNNLPNPTRERAVMYLIDHYTDEQITTTFEQANNSDFLCNNKNGYTFGFDWIVKVENFIKVLEGNYQNKDTIAGKTSSYDLKEVEEMMHNNLPKWQ